MEEIKNEIYELIVALCRIPAPSYKEKERADFIKSWLESRGAESILTDEAGNVILEFGDCTNGPVVIYSAHMDTVFQNAGEDDLKIKGRGDDAVISCPGVGDDTANLVLLMAAAGQLIKSGWQPEGFGVVIAADVCEEGLGNLRGSRELLRRYGDRIRAFVSFDLSYGSLITRAVGSKRFKVCVYGKGGHSFSDFGNRNAIAGAAEIVCALYGQELPDGGVTTYNVGTISGGTSVNAIAQEACLLYEFRSDSAKSMEFMDDQFGRIIDGMVKEGWRVEVEMLGERPGMGQVPEKEQTALVSAVRKACCEAQWEKFGYEREIVEVSGSTDCNITLSHGIPSAAVGAIAGYGEHTYGEYFECRSIEPGYRTVMGLIKGFSV